jgi:hypothetical protein
MHAAPLRILKLQILWTASAEGAGVRAVFSARTVSFGRFYSGPAVAVLAGFHRRMTKAQP